MSRIETGRKLMESFIQKPIELGLSCQTQNFPDLNSFLHAINGNEPYALETVEKYLFGGGSLVTKEILVAQYRIWGNSKYADWISGFLPPEIYLTHFTQVMIASVSQGNPIGIINDCGVFPGEILAFIDDLQVKVRRKRYPDFDKIEQIVKLSSGHDLVLGDQIAIHLGVGFTKLTSEQADSLDDWNKKAAEQKFILK